MKAFAVSCAVSVLFLGILLLSAGRLDYGAAWVYFAIGVISNAGMRLVLHQRSELSRERLSPGADAEGWDRRLLGFGFVLTICMLVVAGLDSGRVEWTPPISRVWSAIGAGVMLAGTAIFLRAMSENQFFTAVVRVQRDRSHAVCDTGPYKVIRHPGNAGMIIGTIGFPLLFRSIWSVIPVVLAVALLIERTRREDSLLERELEGYSAYQLRTRHRLIPGIW